MRSRRDQLHAYQFLSRRVVTALVTGDADGRGAPVHRALRTTFAGAMVAAILVAAFGIYGLVRPGGATAWKGQDGVVVEKETGARYVWYQNRLHPMLNYASARLFLGAAADGTPIARVSRRSLEGVPRATTLGIPGAPDSLPGAKDLETGHWTVCAKPAERSPVTSLAIGAPPPTGALGADDALLVRSPDDGTFWVVWRRTRARLASPPLAGALGLGDALPRLVDAAWLNALPQAPDITAPAIDGRGGDGPPVDGRPTRVGQVLVARTPVGDRYGLVLESGVAPVSPLVAALVRADPERRKAFGGRSPEDLEVPADVLATASTAAPPAGVDRYPARALVRVDADRDRRVLCVGVRPGAEAPSVAEVFATGAAPSGGTRPGGGAGTSIRDDTGELADEVVIRPGRVVVVREEPQPGVSTGTVFVVTDAGRRHAVADEEALRALGYGDVAVPRVPASLLRLLRAGPELSREAASRRV